MCFKSVYDAKTFLFLVVRGYVNKITASPIINSLISSKLILFNKNIIENTPTNLLIFKLI